MKLSSILTAGLVGVGLLAGSASATLTISEDDTAPYLITAPEAACFGNYTVTWAPPLEPMGNPVIYNLYEADNADFENETLIQTGNLNFIQVSDKDSGTYYYRVEEVAGDEVSPSLELAAPVAGRATCW